MKPGGHHPEEAPAIPTMHTIIHPHPRTRRAARDAMPSAGGHRTPLYDCEDQGANLKLAVYLPGVDAAGVTIEARGSDLLVVGCKAHFVRVNWQSLHLEGAQKDYRLRLRLGRGLAYESMHAEMHQGVLVIFLPKIAAARSPARLRRVA